MSKTKRTGHYVLSTHWDREWYESFQDYRFRLVSMIDEVLDRMAADPGFRYFQSDGQSIVWDDYLEVRPERREQVLQFGREGRLRVGPWYVLPDEFLVSGESIVRNLQLGLRHAATIGEPSRAGFICDLFGHISQLPQIFRGFGIDSAFLWRGTNEPTHGAIFRWQAADGSEIIAYRFSPKGGYCAYAFKVRKGILTEETVELEEAVKNFREYLDFETGRCPTPSFLVFDGGDHLEMEPLTSAIIEKANQDFNDVEIVHSHLDGFVEDLREQRSAIARVFKGELREPGEIGDEAWLIPGVASSRVQLKQANARCETELCLWAEPFSAFAAQAGYAYPEQYLAVAWQWLLQNHPHDSICGCSIDQVHKDMAYRFDQCRLIATHLTRDALGYIADRIEVPELGPRDFAVAVFNPGGDPIDGPVDLTLRFPKDTDAVFQEFFAFEKKIGFRLFDAEGKELPYQYVHHRPEVIGFNRPRRKFPIGDIRHEVDITVSLRIPAYGYARLICKPVAEPTRYLGSMQVDDHTIANEHLRVSVGPNGTITLTELAGGNSYPNLLMIEERADIGDGWYHGIAVNDEIHSSVASTADVALAADGIAKATLNIRVTLQVPQHFRFDRMVRADHIVPLVITHRVTLRQGAKFVEVHTEVENTIRDHRIRVLFPTGAQADTHWADQAFDVVERPIAIRKDNARYKELEVETRPQQSWTAVADGKRGLAVVSAGLIESTVRDLPDRPIALTLLRGFKRTVLTSGEPGGQIQGRHGFDYRIVPLPGKVDGAALCRQGQQLAAGLRTVQIENRDLNRQKAANAEPRRLPAVKGFLEVSPAQAVITAVQRDGQAQATLVRMFNATAEPINAAIKPDQPVSKAETIDLEGRHPTQVPFKGGIGKLALSAKQIATIRLTDGG